MRFCVSTQIFITEISMFCQFEVIFLKVLNFSRARVISSYYNLQSGVFLGKDEFFSWSQQKLVLFFSKVPILAIFGYLGTTSRSNSSTYRKNFEKPLRDFLSEVFENIELGFERSISSGLRRD